MGVNCFSILIVSPTIMVAKKLFRAKKRNSYNIQRKWLSQGDIDVVKKKHPSYFSSSVLINELEKMRMYREYNSIYNPNLTIK